MMPSSVGLPLLLKPVTLRETGSEVFCKMVTVVFCPEQGLTTVMLSLCDRGQAVLSLPS